MDFQPGGDQLLIELAEQEEKTASGIYLPDTAREKPHKGFVRAVGRGRENDDGKLLPMHYKVGDFVLFKKYTGSEIKIDGKEYAVISERDILGTFSKVPASV
ncbi:MAG TPA: co-chaperone GroES [Candidatus Rubrimentiphilum sp.]|nr:co-chaperone GroES [Candidatus Rubrimentiphilum sp.]